ncbi:ABC transporter ATP-binding protein [Cohnella suwonensis]|uniref:ABC transporter ATP-binding protein n=1 Tax=Cohnella suwonensis TaxID=696072 RepID=A0ABW0LRE8_9BACL
MTAYENAELPLVLRGTPASKRGARVMELLEQVGIAEFADHYPGELSGGQQQRVSVARSLMLNPPIVLVDEPTGSLDSDNERQLLDTIRGLNKERGMTFVIITHDEQVASVAHRKLTLKDGYLMRSKEKEETDGRAAAETV